MRMVDYEGSRDLNDVGLVLTQDEAAELCDYLLQMRKSKGAKRAYLSQLNGVVLNRELTIAVEGQTLESDEVCAPDQAATKAHSHYDVARLDLARKLRFI